MFVNPYQFMLHAIIHLNVYAAALKIFEFLTVTYSLPM
jgi:hypothetical protein